MLGCLGQNFFQGRSFAMGELLGMPLSAAREKIADMQ